MSVKNERYIDIIDPKFNPCGQPRIAVGYATVGLLGLLVQCGALSVTDQDNRSGRVGDWAAEDSIFIVLYSQS